MQTKYVAWAHAVAVRACDRLRRYTSCISSSLRASIKFRDSKLSVISAEIPAVDAILVSIFQNKDEELVARF